MTDSSVALDPNFPRLEAGDVDAVNALMRALHWLDPGEPVLSCDRAGEGNMNLTLRVVTDQRSLILKQARPWVEKYPAIAAPWDRVLFEQRFYRRVASVPGVAERMPELLGTDLRSRSLLLEDLGAAADLTTLYRGDPLEPDDLAALAAFLRALHDATPGDADPRFANREMRALNHEHIYDLPLRPDNGLDLDAFEPGLRDAADRLQADPEYVALVHETGRRYLADGGALLHGDFFPGSWLRGDTGLRVIDPEFCFVGDPAFDVAMPLAHLVMAGRPGDAAAWLQHYGTDDSGITPAWVARFAAAEIMRRLIGVAQLPLGDRPAGSRAALLRRSHTAMLEQSWRPLLG